MLPSIDTGTDGNPVIVFFDGQKKELKFVKCLNQSCSSNSTPITLASSPTNYLKQDLAIGKDGNPIIVYWVQFSSGESTLRVVKCANQNCSSQVSSSPFPSGTRFGINNAIAILPDGTPVIAYTHEHSLPYKLYLAKCSDQNCSSLSSNLEIASGTAYGTLYGSFVDLNVNKDGHPIISYIGYVDEKTFKVVKCNNSSCSDREINVLNYYWFVSDEGFTSLIIPPDNNPFVVVSYAGGILPGSTAIRANLIGVKCSTSSCSNVPWRIFGYNPFSSYANLSQPYRKINSISLSRP